ncbi:MAG: hypothetical protein Q7S44_04400 [bacterium]|nr:hypothetical protein [bacterium]
MQEFTDAGEDHTDGQKNREVDRKQENKEIVGHSQRPQIDQFPEKSRYVIKDTYKAARANGQVIETIVDGVIKVTASAQNKQVDKDEVHRLAENVSPEDKEKQDKLVEVVKREVRLLQKAYNKLTKGQDAPELRNTPNPFTQTPYTEGRFTEEEVQKFGHAPGIRGLVKRVKTLVPSKDYLQGKEVFMARMNQLLSERVGDLLNLGFRDPSFKPNYSVSGMQVLHEALSAPEAERATIVANALSSFFDTSKGLARQSASYTYYLSKCQEWFKTYKASLTPTHPSSFMTGYLDGENWIREVEITQHLHEDSNRRFLGTVDGYMNHIKQYRDLVTDRVCKLADNISESSLPIKNPGEPADVLQGASLSQEYLDLAAKLAEKIRELNPQGQHSWLSAAVQKMASIDIIGTNQEKLDTELATSQDLLFHSGPIDVIKSILRRKVLASKQYQIDNYGEAVFSSGLVKVGKDYVIMTDAWGHTKRVSKSEYEKIAKAIYKKPPDQEAHQVCFSENSPYMYFQGVTLAFNKGSLFTQSQFMSQDGWHLFDKKYSHNNPQTPGFAVNLTQEPFLVVVREDLREDVENFIRNDLAQDPHWGITNIEEWLKNNLVTISSTHSVDINYNITREDLAKVTNHFTHTHPYQGPQGWFVPSGEQGETANHGQLSPLFTYQLAA